MVRKSWSKRELIHYIFCPSRENVPSTFLYVKKYSEIILCCNSSGSDSNNLFPRALGLPETERSTTLVKTILSHAYKTRCVSFQNFRRTFLSCLHWFPHPGNEIAIAAATTRSRNLSKDYFVSHRMQVWSISSPKMMGPGIEPMILVRSLWRPNPYACCPTGRPLKTKQS